MQTQSFGIEQVYRTGFSCAHPGAQLQAGASDMLATVLSLRTSDGRATTLALLADTPGNRGMSLSNCMDEAVRWLSARTRVSPTEDATIAQLDRMACIDLWSSAGFTPVTSPGRAPRTVDALVSRVAAGSTLWVEHVTTVDLLGPTATSEWLCPLEELEFDPPSLPMLGAGATVVHGSVLYPATVYRVAAGAHRVGVGTVVAVRRDLLEPCGAMGGAPISRHVPHPWAPLERFSLEQDGRWRSLMAPRLLLHIGSRNASPGL